MYGLGNRCVLPQLRVLDTQKRIEMLQKCPEAIDVHEQLSLHVNEITIVQSDFFQIGPEKILFSHYPSRQQ